MPGHYPHISKGFGKLTPELWQRQMWGLQWLETNWMRIQFKGQRRQDPVRSAGRSFFHILIEGATSIGQNRWRYDFAEYELGENEGEFDVWVLKEGGRMSESSNPFTQARNIAEAGNTGSGLESYGINVEPYMTPQATVRMGIRPIAVGSIVQAWVEKRPATEDPPPGFVTESIWFHAQNGAAPTVRCLAGKGDLGTTG